METALAVPLLRSQIDVANRLHQQLRQWKDTDQALEALHIRFPGFDMDSTLLKVVAINQLYGTQIYMVVPMARHVTEVMRAADGLEDTELVEQIAAFSGRKHLSFASKFAHFFIHMERFPIYDSFARKMVAHHLGAYGRAIGTTSPYKAFVENIERLKQRAALSCSNKELDRYLWLAGLYLLWKRYMDEKDVNKKKKLRMNAEVEALFNDLSSLNSAELAQLYPQHPEE
ncbi:hypothetical protein [Dictyobacter formicarum]|uniref:Uncharacterized protein n=1 Tax=Dictyobacter formicarum TaxID=2778368 RepID=A0ABQ3VT90_9CHLR|nr:hypothetical protein [Dictyobacter formicarum]GHO89165.1 hypothetical protein KSZ_71710 [Dictyobacter formicarum]